MKDVNNTLEKNLGLLGVPADLMHGVVPLLVEMPREIVVFSRTTPESARDKGPHMHSRHVLCLCLKGGATIAIDGEMVSLDPGDVVLLFPFERHLFHRFQGSDILWAFVGFDLAGFEPLEVLRHRVLRMSDGLLRQFAEFVSCQVEARGASDVLASSRVGARLMLLLIQLATDAGRSAPRLNVGGNPVVRAVLAEVTRRIATPFSLKDIANAVHVSESHLRRTFQSATGVTLGDFVRRSRVRHAQSLLARGGLRVGEVARLSGFSGQHAFSRTFKSVAGVSAKSWRGEMDTLREESRPKVRSKKVSKLSENKKQTP